MLLYGAADAVDAVVVFISYGDGVGAHKHHRWRHSHRALHLPLCGPDVDIYVRCGGGDAAQRDVLVEGDRELDLLADDVGLVGARVRGDRDRRDFRRRVGRRGRLVRVGALAAQAHPPDLDGVLRAVGETSDRGRAAGVRRRGAGVGPRSWIGTARGLLDPVFEPRDVRSAVVRNRPCQLDGLVLRCRGQDGGPWRRGVVVRDGHTYAIHCQGGGIVGGVGCGRDRVRDGDGLLGFGNRVVHGRDGYRLGVAPVCGAEGERCGADG